MATIPLNVILVWPSTNATIPSGWSRQTALDSKYPKASGTEDPAVTGGAATHTHTSPAHTHTIAAHTHSVTTNNATSGVERGNNGGSSAVFNGHVHNSNVGGVVGGDISDAASYAATDNLPPYYGVIFISPTSSPQNIPDNVIALWNSADLPTGFVFTDGTGGIPDLRNRYMRGTTTGGNGGVTGGTINHEHAIDHNHTTQSHSHSDTSAAQNVLSAGTGGGSPVAGSHTHTLSLPSNSSATNAYTGNAGSADDVEPAYHKLLAIQNTSGAVRSAPIGLIALWLGTIANIPTGWSLCDGENGTPDLTDKYIKIANTTGEIGNTGGSNTHTHAASNSHTHTATAAHAHTSGGSSSEVGTNANGISGGSSDQSPVTHYHVISGVGNATASYGNATVQANSSSNEPEYTVAAYIMLTQEVGAALLQTQI